jgi:hypothetical protein
MGQFYEPAYFFRGYVRIATVNESILTKMENNRYASLTTNIKPIKNNIHERLEGFFGVFQGGK